MDDYNKKIVDNICLKTTFNNNDNQKKQKLNVFLTSLY